MTTKADIYIYIVGTGKKKPKKVKIKKLLKILNQSNYGFTNRFFVNEKDANKYINENK
tara:strand:+ start:328 stop:501 length:174 start_codon:yes stop_codon:yes gene_type:complete